MSRLREKIRNKRGAHIAEFGMAFSAFFFVVLIPCINLLGFAASYALACRTTQETADSISKATSKRQVAEIINQANNNLHEVSLFKTFRLKPRQNAYQLDIAIESLKGHERLYTLNSKKTPGIDRSGSLVRYRLTTSYTAAPIIDLGSVPALGKVWVVGCATPIKQVVYKEIEHPEYLQAPKD